MSPLLVLEGGLSLLLLLLLLLWVMLSRVLLLLLWRLWLLLLLLLPCSQSLLPGRGQDYAVHRWLEGQSFADPPQRNPSRPGLDMLRQTGGGCKHGSSGGIRHTEVPHHKL
jgi:hypothetical protein